MYFPYIYSLYFYNDINTYVSGNRAEDIVQLEVEVHPVSPDHRHEQVSKMLPPGHISEAAVPIKILIHLSCATMRRPYNMSYNL